MIAQCGTLEISAARLRHNLELFRARLGPGVEVCATVKADAYGHGMQRIAPLLREAGVKWLCVYSLHEAWELDNFVPGLGQQVNVLVLAPLSGGISAVTAEFLGKTRARVAVADAETLTQLGAAMQAIGSTAMLHLQIDTGLTRAGLSPADAPALIQQAARTAGVELEGMYSHLSHGDVPGHPTIAQQARTLNAIFSEARRLSPGIVTHLQNSGGAWHGGRLEGLAVNMARVGIGLYGLQPSAAEPIAGLQPIARLTAPILAIHERPAGVGVGYGHTFVTTRPSRLAILPVGYADGYPRALSNLGVVQVAGKTAPVVGRVSMDQIIVDVTACPAAIGDEVTVLSDDPAAENCMDRIATRLGTIGYEIATGLGARLRRQVVD